MLKASSSRAARKQSQPRTRVPSAVSRNVRRALGQLESTELIRIADADMVEAKLLAYFFRHALVQEAAYDSVLKNERRLLHRAAARAVESLYPTRLDENAALLARHYELAGDDERTFFYADRAGDAAVRLFAYPEARGHYATADRALQRLPQSPQNIRRRVDTLIKFSSVALRLDGPERTLTHVAEARALLDSVGSAPDAGDPTRQAYLDFYTGEANLHRSQPAEAIRYMQRVLETAGAGSADPALTAIPANVMGRAFAAQGRFREAQQLLERAAPILEESSNWYEWVLSVGFLALVRAMQGATDEGLAHAQRIQARARALGTLTGMGDSHALTALVLMQADAYQRAYELTRVSLDAARQLGDALLTYISLNVGGWCQVRLGDLAGARASFAEADAVAAATGGHLLLVDWFTVARAELALVSGDLPAAIAGARQTLDHAAKVGALYSSGIAERVWGLALAQQPSAAVDAGSHFERSLEYFARGGATVEAARTRRAWDELLNPVG